MRANDMHLAGYSVEDIALAVRKRPEQIPSYVLLGERLKTIYEPEKPAHQGVCDER